MKKYRAYWMKRYFMSGVLVVNADSEGHAQHIVNLKIGDLEGSMQWIPEANEIDVLEVDDAK
jgi:hypothetical protein